MADNKTTGAGSKASKTPKTTGGHIGVTTEDIFPVIKKFLYSDREIFLREIVANAVDATQKAKALASSGELKGELGDLDVHVELDEKAGILKITDRGIGMTAEEIDKYINRIAFSSAGEFLEKYKDKMGSIIGHFGLGFYSAFMVSDKVTIDSLSYKDGSQAVQWTCDGSPEFKMGPSGKTDRGTTVTLYLARDAREEYGHKYKIESLLNKYCKFMPFPVVFGKKTEWKDGKSVDTDEDNIINDVEPIWTRMPSTLTEEDYSKFYKALYPMEDEPMFHIHINVDFPFHLTGVLYFPKIKERMAIDKNKIQLYCNQMFVTDHVDNIVPDFLTLLHGVIDSPDIPLNVSRSYLQSDANVKKISTFITKKAAACLEEIFKEHRTDFEAKWDNVKLFIEYGMITHEEFCEKALKFALLKNVDGKNYSLDEYKSLIEANQKNKDGKLVYLYATDTQAQYSYIEAAKAKGYDVLLMDCELDSHFVGLLESKLKDSAFARVDSDSVDNLVQKEDKARPELSEEEKKSLDEMVKAAIHLEGCEFTVDARNLGGNEVPILLTQTEFIRRYRDMSKMGGGMNYFGTMPQSYNVIVNMEHPLVEKFFKDKDTALLGQMMDLALLEAGLLKGKDLTDFIRRGFSTLLG